VEHEGAIAAQGIAPLCGSESLRPPPWRATRTEDCWSWRDRDEKEGKSAALKVQSDDNNVEGRIPA
jgi:hypothetical protein